LKKSVLGSGGVSIIKIFGRGAGYSDPQKVLTCANYGLSMLGNAPSFTTIPACGLSQLVLLSPFASKMSFALDCSVWHPKTATCHVALVSLHQGSVSCNAPDWHIQTTRDAVS